MKIPFNIKYRTEIESGKYKVVTKDDRIVKIISFEVTDSNNCPIAAQFRLCAGTPVVYLFDENGLCKGEGHSDYDLFVIIPDEYPNKVEMFVRALLSSGDVYNEKAHSFLPSETDDEYVKDMTKKVIALVKEEYFPKWKRLPLGPIAYTGKNIMYLNMPYGPLEVLHHGDYYIPMSELEKLPKDDGRKIEDC